MRLRRYRPSDAEALAAIYRDAVLGTGAGAYTPRQTEIWASFGDDIEDFRERLGQGFTLVASRRFRWVAFGQLSPPDHIALLYTASGFARRGYATEIFKRLEAQAIAQGRQRLHTDASRISKNFFLKMGFRLVETELTERKGELFERFKMEKVPSRNSNER